VLPTLQATYTGIVVLASQSTTEHSIAQLRGAGLVVEREPQPTTLATLGRVRRTLLAFTLREDTQHLHLCDWDRAIHWAEFYPDELGEVVEAIPGYDCLILGRTPRAFGNHPRVQRDTESLINHCFGLAWGQPLDVTAASRGLSRRAAQALVDGCDEPTIGNDCVWPLFLARQDRFTIGYAATEGLEWETPDRFGAEIEAMGGLDAWLAEHDADVGRWAERLQLARIEVEALQRWRFLGARVGNT
jgi:hypothetical protein